MISQNDGICKMFVVKEFLEIGRKEVEETM